MSRRRFVRGLWKLRKYKEFKDPLSVLRKRTQHLKAETFALYLAARDPRTPWYAKLLAAGIVAYAFSPIDLIPDFVPVLGYLDDLILIPMGIALAIKLVPHQVLSECRARAQESIQNGKPVSRVAGAIIILIWLALATLCIVWAYEAFMAQPRVRPTKPVELTASISRFYLKAMQVRPSSGPQLTLIGMFTEKSEKRSGIDGMVLRCGVCCLSKIL